MKGLDISAHQGNLNLSNLSSSGYDFLILRGGYTGYGDSRIKHKDSQFENFYNQSKNLNIPIGVYYYSCATTKDEGISEANFLYEECLKNKKFEFPIYIDIENEKWQNENRNSVTEAIIGFCETLEDLGYFTGIYANLNWFYNKIDTDKLSKYTKWVACWSSNKPPFKYNAFDLWQNSNSGIYNSNRVDTDISFIDFPQLIKSKKLNGYNNLISYNGELPILNSQKYFKKNDRGLNVKKIQRFLNWAINVNLKVDGIYGPKTIDAVKKFQKICHIKEDGLWGKITNQKAIEYKK